MMYSYRSTHYGSAQGGSTHGALTAARANSPSTSTGDTRPGGVDGNAESPSAGRDAGRAARLRTDLERAVARRARPVQPGHVCHHLDAVDGGEADGPYGRQEH